MQYTLRNLQKATEYSVIVSAIPSDEASKDYLIVTTLAAGQCL